MGSESKAQGAALRGSHTSGILFLSFGMNTEHRRMLVPRQDSSVSGKIYLAQHLAAEPCPGDTSCPTVTISNVPWPQLSAGTLLIAEQGEGSISRVSRAGTLRLPRGYPPAFEGIFQHCIIFMARELGYTAPGKLRCLLVMGRVTTALLLFCREPSLPA